MYFDINETTEEWIRKWNSFKPNIVIGYPSAIKIMAQLTENGKISSGIERVITCGEPLGRYLRKYLEGVWKTQIVNFYGLRMNLISNLTLMENILVEKHRGQRLREQSSVIQG